MTYFEDFNRSEDEAYVQWYGDPILEIEADYAMEKMGVSPNDPYYYFWRSQVERDLQNLPYNQQGEV